MAGNGPAEESLAIRLQAMGDVIITLRYLRALQRSLPGPTSLVSSLERIKICDFGPLRSATRKPLRALQRRELLDQFSGLRLGNTQLMQALKVQPQLGAGSEEVRQAQRGISGDGALAVQNQRHTIRGHLDPACELGRAYVPGAQFCGEVLPRMDRDRRHVPSRTGIDEFHLRRSGRSVWPFKTNSPLLVDSDRILSAAFGLEGLKAVALQGCQVVERANRPQPVKLEPRGPLNAGQRLETFPGGASSRAFAPIANDHAQ